MIDHDLTTFSAESLTDGLRNHVVEKEDTNITDNVDNLQTLTVYEAEFLARRETLAGNSIWHHINLSHLDRYVCKEKPSMPLCWLPESDRDPTHYLIRSEANC